ncbi:Hsp20/alpha crystallin family protein [Kiritimatiellaeota bacterium B1221]|nr:Hsp20/alpha crystallin family protein [Kiritimatiellaeota bacterium B1221]
MNKLKSVFTAGHRKLWPAACLLLGTVLLLQLFGVIQLPDLTDREQVIPQAVTQVTPVPNVAQNPDPTPTPLSNPPSSWLPSPSLALPGFTRQWDPFAEMERMQAEMDEMMQRAFQGMGSYGHISQIEGITCEMTETADQYQVHVFLPPSEDVDQRKISISLEGRTLTVFLEQGASVKGGGASRQKFTQSLTLPGPVVEHSEKLKEEKDGSLLITVDKKHPALTRASFI